MISLPESAVDTSRSARRRAASRIALALLFAGAGALHFVIPAQYLRIMPSWLPAPLALVYVSGAAEMAGGIGLLRAGTRRAAAVGLVLLLAAVWPANLQMLLDARAAGVPGWWEALLWLRLPLQVPLMAWVWWAAGGERIRRVPASGDALHGSNRGMSPPRLPGA